MRPVPHNYMFCCDSKEGQNSWLGADFTAPSLVLVVLQYNGHHNPDLLSGGLSKYVSHIQNVRTNTALVQIYTGITISVNKRKYSNYYTNFLLNDFFHQLIDRGTL